MNGRTSKLLHKLAKTCSTKFKIVHLQRELICIFVGGIAENLKNFQNFQEISVPPTLTFIFGHELE